GAIELAEIGDADLFAMGDKFAVRLLNFALRRHLQSESIHRRQILARASLQNHNVPGARRMLDVLRRIETGGDLQTQHLYIKTAAFLDAVALQRAVSERLRHINAPRKTGRSEI